MSGNLVFNFVGAHRAIGCLAVPLACAAVAVPAQLAAQTAIPEARSIAMTYFTKVASKCGADYFVEDPKVSVVQMRSVTLSIEQNGIGEADRMNGV